jgi:hypothetical protein
MFFIETGVKINHYIEHNLENHLFEHAKNLHREDYSCFEQGSAPSHMAKRWWLEDNLFDFFSLSGWPA